MIVAFRGERGSYNKFIGIEIEEKIVAFRGVREGANDFGATG